MADRESIRQWLWDGMDEYVAQYRNDEFDADELAELGASGHCALCPEWIDRAPTETELAELATTIESVVATEATRRGGGF